MELHPGLHWVKVSDENTEDNDQWGLSDKVENADGKVGVFVYVTKATGFGDTVGQIVYHELKELEEGKYGA